MIKQHNPKIGMWKENVLRKPAKMIKSTSAMFIEIPMAVGGRSDVPGYSKDQTR
jgi:hypothetical protein